MAVLPSFLALPLNAITFMGFVLPYIKRQNLNHRPCLILNFEILRIFLISVHLYAVRRRIMQKADPASIKDINIIPHSDRVGIVAVAVVVKVRSSP